MTPWVALAASPGSRRGHQRRSSVAPVGVAGLAAQVRGPVAEQAGVAEMLAPVVADPADDLRRGVEPGAVAVDPARRPRPPPRSAPAPRRPSVRGWPGSRRTRDRCRAAGPGRREERRRSPRHRPSAAAARQARCHGPAPTRRRRRSSGSGPESQDGTRPGGRRRVASGHGAVPDADRRHRGRRAVGADVRVGEPVHRPAVGGRAGRRPGRRRRRGRRGAGRAGRRVGLDDRLRQGPADAPAGRPHRRRRRAAGHARGRTTPASCSGR